MPEENEIWNSAIEEAAAKLDIQANFYKDQVEILKENAGGQNRELLKMMRNLASAIRELKRREPISRAVSVRG